MDSVAKIIEQWLMRDRQQPRKQRHTARQVYTRLLEEHQFKGAEVSVRRWVRQWKAAQGWGRSEAVLPLDPEVAREAEVNWGTAWVQMAGLRRQVKFFVRRPRYSGKPFVRAYPWERQEMFFDAHMHAFSYYGGVFRELVYDNLRQAVKQILRGRQRVEQQRFVSFRSHYTFQARYCTPGRGQEKRGAEGLISFARRNFLVPLPQVEDFEELNQLLAQRCEQYGTHRIGGREDDRTVDERFEAERGSLLPLPDQPFENFKPVRVKVDAYQTARVDHNRYSVPRENLAFIGRHGTGKSHAAKATGCCSGRWWSWSTAWAKRVKNDSCSGSSNGSIALSWSSSMSSVTSLSPRREPSCCFKSSPIATKGPRSW